MMLHVTSTIRKGWCHIRSCIECIEQGKSVLFTCPFISSIWEMDTGQIYWMNWLPIALLTSIQNIKPISVCIYHNFPMKKSSCQIGWAYFPILSMFISNRSIPVLATGPAWTQVHGLDAMDWGMWKSTMFEGVKSTWINYRWPFYRYL